MSISLKNPKVATLAVLLAAVVALAGSPRASSDVTLLEPTGSSIDLASLTGFRFGGDPALQYVYVGVVLTGSDGSCYAGVDGFSENTERVGDKLDARYYCDVLVNLANFVDPFQMIYFNGTNVASYSYSAPDLDSLRKIPNPQKLYLVYNDGANTNFSRIATFDVVTSSGGGGDTGGGGSGGNTDCNALKTKLKKVNKKIKQAQKSKRKKRLKKLKKKRKSLKRDLKSC